MLVVNNQHLDYSKQAFLIHSLLIRSLIRTFNQLCRFKVHMLAVKYQSGFVFRSLIRTFNLLRRLKVLTLAVNNQHLDYSKQAFLIHSLLIRSLIRTFVSL